MPHSSLAVANEFLDRGHREARSLTHMQLQKLVYLAHGWNLAILAQPLIEEHVEAWEFGPVVRNLYDALRDYGRRPITRLIRWGDDTPFPSDDGAPAREPIAPEEKRLIDRVWELYGGFEAFKLSALTHADDSPWSAVYAKGKKNGVIANESIRQYFAHLITRKAA